MKIAPGVRVRASSRGVRTSIGPRAARVHVGTGRTRVSTGVGPLTASTGVGMGLGGGRRRSGSTGMTSGESTRALARAAKRDEAAASNAAVETILEIHRVKFDEASRPMAPPVEVVDDPEEAKRLRKVELRGSASSSAQSGGPRSHGPMSATLPRSPTLGPSRSGNSGRRKPSWMGCGHPFAQTTPMLS